MSSTATPIDRAREEAIQSSQDPLGEMNREIFIRDYLARTAGSRESKIRNADHHVDKSSIVFGSGNWLDELNYPIVMRRADGSRLHDIDGYDYVDVLQGLGANLFGHNPEFVRSAIAEQLEQGFPIGVQTCLAAEVAKQITCLTGMDRVCFSNTGTEAVMTAIRVARAATGRRKVAIFTNSYHGHTDTVLMRAPLAEYARKGLIRRSQNQRWLSPIARRM
ncbi:MAG: aminotransferase class III-fold pyridoxal phosphate-dependent enzyme, partial [Planctomycetota bacterium]